MKETRWDDSICLEGGKNLLWDVTVVDTLCASHVKNCSKHPGAAAENAENKKFSTYSELLDDYCFVPIGIETFGAWGPEGHKLIKDIGKKLKEVTGEQRSTFFLTQRISMAGRDPQQKAWMKFLNSS